MIASSIAVLWWLVWGGSPKGAKDRRPYPGAVGTEREAGRTPGILNVGTVSSSTVISTPRSRDAMPRRFAIASVSTWSDSSSTGWCYIIQDQAGSKCR